MNEKAHTPTAHEVTTDEREALDYAIRCAIPADLDYRPVWKLIRAIQDSVVAEGFRRTEVPEPSTDRCYWCNQAARGAAVWQGDGDRYASCGQDGHGALFSPAEPQGEPSDAQVEAALRVFFDGNPDYMTDPAYIEDMRAALRAANEVR